MSEDLKEGMSSLKKGIIGVAGTMAAAIGTYVTTQFNSILGIEEEGGGAATEVVVESNQQQSVNVTGPEIIINIPEQKAAPTQTIIRETVKEVPAAQPVQPVVVEEPKETNAERMARLKKMREERNGGN
jgi:hypothetical protein